MSDTSNLPTIFLHAALTALRSNKAYADKAVAQLPDDKLHVALDANTNSIAVIMKHVAGNLLSRWTDFLTTDGEKPNRNRDMEFVIEPETTSGDVIDYWERGWKCAFDAIEPLTADDLLKTVSIRGESHTVMQAINRQLTHYPNHIGQIIFLAKHFRSSEWQTLSIPRNKSADFNKYLEAKKPSEHRLDAAANFVNEIKEEK